MKEKNSKAIKSEAYRLGFDYCGIAEAGFMEDDARRLEKWLNGNRHATMAYMANHFELRTDPTKLQPGAKSVITLLKNYFPSQNSQRECPKSANTPMATITTK